jgi:hypothetical protein
MMKAVYDHLVETLKETALQKVFEKKDTIAVPEALEIINRAMDKLHDAYGAKKTPSPKSAR